MPEEKKNKIKDFAAKNRKLIIVLLVAALGSAGVWYYMSRSTSTVTYTTSPAAPGSIVETIGTTGTVEPIQDVFLTFKSGGYVEAQYVKLGDTVSTGQILAEERSSDLEAALQQSSASLTSAQANYDKLIATQGPEELQAENQVLQAKINLDSASADLERNQMLYSAGAISLSEMESFQKAYDLAQVQYKSAQANLESVVAANPSELAAAAAQIQSASASVQTSSNNLNDSVMIAPFDGFVALINGNVGQWTGGGSPPVGTAATSQFGIEVSSRELQMTAEINEADIASVQVGQVVDFTIDAFPDKIFTGRLIAIAPKAVDSNSLKVYKCTISIDDWSLLKSGMPASINIHIKSAENVLLVPCSAVTYAKSYFTRNSTAIQEGSSDSNEDVEYLVVLNQGKPEVRQVVMGISDNVNIEVKSGLKEGDQVITADSSGTATKTNSSGSSQNNRNEGPHMF